MITKRLLSLFAGSCLAVLVSSCSMFGSSKKPTPGAPHSSEQFDPSSGVWVPATKVDLPPPAPENAALAATEKKEKSQGGIMKKVGNVVKKPLTWLPWHKTEAEEAATAPKALPAPAQKTN
jgi:hypothetical protein